jgi:hypothetical protein
MDEALSENLQALDAAIRELEHQMATLPALGRTVFDDTREWRKLLTFKLLPQLAGKDVLVAAVAGGTNTGKSTIFNLLVGTVMSPVRATAAATCRPLLAGSPLRFDQGLTGNLVPGLKARLQTHDDDPVNRAAPPDVLFMKPCAHLPDFLVLLDVPDVDSIDLINWDVAGNIQAVCDVLIAVLTGEKYQDDKVIEYFRQAAGSGRIILPLMNKADAAEDFRVARAQLDDFCRAVGIDETTYFAVPHDFGLMETCDQPVLSLSGTAPLREHLEQLDVVETKERVYRDSLNHFNGQTEIFLKRLDRISASFDALESLFNNRATAMAATYDPEPDAKVGRLLHEYIKARRGTLSRTMGNVGSAVYGQIAPVGRAVGRMIQRRLSLASVPAPPTPAEVRAHHARELEVRIRDFIRECTEMAQNLDAPARELLDGAFEHLDVATTVKNVENATLTDTNISEAFRKHAEKTLESWWEDHTVRRRVLVELDALLMFAPTAVAVPLALYTGGVGVPEVIAAAGPLAGDFFSRIMEHQFADRWFDLIAPWHAEQQARFKCALITHVLAPALAPLAEGRSALHGEAAQTIRRIHEQCLKVS